MLNSGRNFRNGTITLAFNVVRIVFVNIVVVTVSFMITASIMTFINIDSKKRLLCPRAATLSPLSRTFPTAWTRGGSIPIAYRI